MSSFTEPLEYQFTGSFYQGRPVYIITKEFVYCFGSLESPIAKIVIPQGFKTDLASIPWPIRLIFPPDGPWAKAAVIHDYLCNVKDISFLATDSIFHEAMIISGVNRFVAFILFSGVRLYHTFIKRKYIG